MNTVIRCHVKNIKRLNTLEDEILSWHYKSLFKLGRLYLVDDQSPMDDEVFALAKKYGVHYSRTSGNPDTKNGLYHSLLVQDEYPVFCCVDDATFGFDIYNRLKTLLDSELAYIPNYGIIGTFACYEDQTRNQNKVANTDLWKVPIDILYALVAHMFSKDFSQIVLKNWDNVILGLESYPNCCDDLWIKSLLKKTNFSAYNTMRDYAQHTGGDNRTFGESNSNSEYYTKMFVGE